MASNKSIDDLLAELERQISMVEGKDGSALTPQSKPLSMTQTLSRLKKDILILRDDPKEVFLVARGNVNPSLVNVYSSAEVAERAVYADIASLGVERNMSLGTGTISRDAEKWNIAKHTVKSKTWKEEMGIK